MVQEMGKYITSFFGSKKNAILMGKTSFRSIVKFYIRIINSRQDQIILLVGEIVKAFVCWKIFACGLGRKLAFLGEFNTLSLK